MKRKKERLSNKINQKLHWILFLKTGIGDRLQKWYPTAIRGRRYAKRKKSNKYHTQEFNTVYFTQIPNEGAGIGHQIANYISGYHYARVFKVAYAYPGFRDKEWEAFLGFGEGEVSVEELKRQGYSFRQLPFLNEFRDEELMKNIIASYQGEKVILKTELDQFYQKQFEEISHIKNKFETAEARANESDPYDRSRINIALHIRRGDIVHGNQKGEKTFTKRWLTLDYYIRLLEDLTKQIKQGRFEKYGIKKEKSIEIYLFSQGESSEYKVFEKYGTVNYCVDKSAKESFLMMVRADILITSKSSFSYKPALLADGIRICPPNFWHGYPEEEQWIVAEEDGSLCWDDR